MVSRLVSAGLSAALLGAAPPSFTRPDGTALRMNGKVYVWCGKWDDGANVRTLRIQQGSPFSPPWWMVEIRLSVARRGATVAFPTLTGKTGTMFVSQPRTQVEASADSERSRGSLTVLDDVTCRRGSHVRVRIRATLAGEESGTPSITVRGTFTGTVGTTVAPGVSR